MPHLVIEHSASLSPEQIDRTMAVALDCAGECGFIAREDVKVRAIEYEKFLCGDGRTSFVHVTVRLLAGRSDEKKESLAVTLRAALSDLLPMVQSISIDVIDMNPVAYKKRLC